MSNRTVTLKPEKGKDGVYRVTIDIYYCFVGALELVKLLNRQTKVKWKHLGCFMDTCGFGVIEKPPDKFEFTYPWNDPNAKENE